MKYIDALVLADVKLEDLLPTSQFLMKGFAKSFWLGRNRNGGGVMIFLLDFYQNLLLQATLEIYT